MKDFHGVTWKTLVFQEVYSFLHIWLKEASERSGTASCAPKVLFLAGCAVGDTLDLFPSWKQTPLCEGCEECKASLLTQWRNAWTKHFTSFPSYPPLCLLLQAAQGLTFNWSPYTMHMGFFTVHMGFFNVWFFGVFFMFLKHIGF